jgi:hypothetical protein
LHFRRLDFSDVTADVELFFIRAIFTVELSVKGVNGNQAGLNTWLDFKNYCVHPVYWSILIRSWEKFLAPDSAGYNVADQRISFWQIRGKVHFFPFVLLFNAQTRKAEIRPNGIRSHEVDLAI